jgi:serine/threonine protein kinase
MMAPPSAPPPPARGPQSEPARRLIGTTIADRYKVLSLLGEGAMGAVYLVEQTAIRRRAALKLLNEEMVKSPEAVARFEREALAAAQIHHPNVVAATDSGRTSDGAPFVVFEYADGQSLYERIIKGPLPPPLALHITRQVASALVSTHAIGVIHRDLKAENILLVSGPDDDVIAKVLDFGMAKLSADLLAEAGDANKPTVITRFGTALGTPAYMSPEQAVGGAVDGRADLYSLGILLYEMLTSTLPFECDEPAELLRLHLMAPVPSLKERMPGINVPPALELMVLKLLEKSPENRFESAKALLEAIDALVQTQKLQYPPTASASSANPASENVTMVAPPDLAARLFEQLPPEEQSPSLALALKKLKPPSEEEKARDPKGGASAPPDGPPKPAAAVDKPNPPPASDTKQVALSGKLLDAIRARLPERHRGISQRALGLSVGAVLLLPILILLLIFITSSDDSSTPGNAGLASERAIEKAVNGDVRDLAKLAAKYPNDSRVIRALAKVHLARKDYAGGLRAFSSLVRLNPAMASDDEMLQIVSGAALMPETSDAAISMLESQLGDKGVGVLSDLAERTMEPWKSKLNASVQKGTTRALASEATLILLDLRAAPRCEDKRTLLKRAGQQGDARTLAYLQAVQQMTTGCGPNGQTDCWACLRRGTALTATMEAITKRLGG